MGDDNPLVARTCPERSRMGPSPAKGGLFARLLAARRSFFRNPLDRFRGQGQSENRNPPRPGDICPARIVGIRQIQCLAMFATIDFCVASPRLFHIPTLPLDQVRQVEPALQMSAAGLALFVFFIAGALPRRFYFHFVARKLRGSCRVGYRRFACGQEIDPRCGGLNPPISFTDSSFYSKAFAPRHITARF